MNVKGIRSFLGHVGIYRRFIKDFSKIVKPLCNLLEKDASFVFDEICLRAFQLIKEKLVSTPIVIVPDWLEPFEIMCDASDYAVGQFWAKDGRKFSGPSITQVGPSTMLNWTTLP